MHAGVHTRVRIHFFMYIDTKLVSVVLCVMDVQGKKQLCIMIEQKKCLAPSETAFALHSQCLCNLYIHINTYIIVQEKLMTYGNIS